MGREPRGKEGRGSFVEILIWTGAVTQTGPHPKFRVVQLDNEDEGWG